MNQRTVPLLSTLTATRPKLLDLCCCAGGAAMGYHRAGFDVVGVDINPQPNYPFPHVVADGLDFLAEFAHEFDAIHVSAPCQRYSITANQNPDSDHPDLIGDFRAALITSGKPYVLENVQGSPLREYVTLCGSEFGLTAPDVDGVTVQLRRHRLFESNVFLMGAGGCQHLEGVPYASVYGYGGASGPAYRDRPRGKGYVPRLDVCRELIGAPWMTKRELSESIPPAYTEFIGAQLLAAIA